jgi:hypothetical protein
MSALNVRIFPINAIGQAGLSTMLQYEGIPTIISIVSYMYVWAAASKSCGVRVTGLGCPPTLTPAYQLDFEIGITSKTTGRRRRRSWIGFSSVEFCMLSTPCFVHSAYSFYSSPSSEFQTHMVYIGGSKR